MTLYTQVVNGEGGYTRPKSGSGLYVSCNNSRGPREKQTTLAIQERPRGLLIVSLGKLSQESRRKDTLRKECRVPGVHNLDLGWVRSNPEALVLPRTLPDAFFLFPLTSRGAV